MSKLNNKIVNMKEYQKQYYIDHKDYHKKYRKNYYDKRKVEYVTCDVCNIPLKFWYRKRHYLTNKHINNLKESVNKNIL